MNFVLQRFFAYGKKNGPLESEHGNRGLTGSLLVLVRNGDVLN